MSIRADDKVHTNTGVPLKTWLHIFIQQGYSGRHIANKLCISETSVRNYIKYYSLRLKYKTPANIDWGWRGSTPNETGPFAPVTALGQDDAVVFSMHWSSGPPPQLRRSSASATVSTPRHLDRHQHCPRCEQK